jgi:aldehyde dehydrogenase (NAD+)
MASLSARIVIRAANRELEIPTGLFINNEFVPSADSPNDLIQYDLSHLFDKDHDLFERSLVNPATEEAICSVIAGKSHQSRLR